MDRPSEHHRRRLRTRPRLLRPPSVVGLAVRGVATLGFVFALTSCAQVQTDDDPIINGSGGTGGSGAGGTIGPGPGGSGGVVPPPVPTGVAFDSGTTTVSSPGHEMQVSVGGPVGKGSASSPEFTLDYYTPTPSER